MNVAKETKNGYGFADQKSLCVPHYNHSIWLSHSIYHQGQEVMLWSISGEPAVDWISKFLLTSKGI